jgi:hypothetical protein
MHKEILMEELKVIMDAVAQLGTEAKWAFFAWLGYKAFNVSLMTVTILTVAWWLIRAFQRGMESESILNRLGDEFGTAWYERRKLVRLIVEMKAKGQR